MVSGDSCFRRGKLAESRVVDHDTSFITGLKFRTFFVIEARVGGYASREQNELAFAVFLIAFIQLLTGKVTLTLVHHKKEGKFGGKKEVEQANE